MQDDRQAMFTQRYAEGTVPWDTGITPPEIVALLDELPAGRALDLGCGTGTNLATLLKAGWQADGVDFVPQAVNRAHAKLGNFPETSWAVYCHDVTRLDDLPDLRAPYDLVVDIGCGHGIAPDARPAYVRGIASRMRPGATLMLYAHEPSEDRPHGLRAQDVAGEYGTAFEVVWQRAGADNAAGRPASWYRLRRRER
jgi:SAM-dependent methyltransferase